MFSLISLPVPSQQTTIFFKFITPQALEIFGVNYNDVGPARIMPPELAACELY